MNRAPSSTVTVFQGQQIIPGGHAPHPVAVKLLTLQHSEVAVSERFVERVDT